MKAIIAGGRDYHLTHSDDIWLMNLWSELKFDEVLHGDSRGTDRDAGVWATRYGLKVTAVPADWHTYGRRAGPLRNQEMVDYVGSTGILITFPGGDGTADVIRRAKKIGMRHVQR